MISPAYWTKMHQLMQSNLKLKVSRDVSTQVLRVKLTLLSPTIIGSASSQMVINVFSQ